MHFGDVAVVPDKFFTLGLLGFPEAQAHVVAAAEDATVGMKGACGHPVVMPIVLVIELANLLT